MHNHFDKNLNLKALILDRRPKTIVECGAGSGELTRQISGLLDVYQFDFHVISDKPVEGLDSRIKWVSGLSYNALDKFVNGKIDLCIIDTDHNYWTLMTELAAVYHKIPEGGLIAMHDVDTFYHDTGMALSYSTGEPYPREQIEQCAPYGGVGDALIEFLYLKKLDYKLLDWNHASNGAALIEKRSCKEFAIVIPGSVPVYA